MTDDTLTPILEDPPPPYTGKMEPGHFEILVHGGHSNNPMVLEFVDIHPDLSGWLEDELSAAGPFLDDLGGITDLDGLAVILMEYVVHHTNGPDGEEHESEWVEVSRTEAAWLRKV